jgi:heparin binding hemagglutinin HbhA
MSENQNPNTNPQPGQDHDTTDLMKELREMGQQLEAAFRTAIESERAKQLQQDIAGGVRELTHQVQSAVKSVQTDPRFQQAEERGKQAFEQARESKIVNDVQETIVNGLAALNVQLRKVVERIDAETNKATASRSTPTQNVPVEHDTPATGETTRLDDNDQTTL